MLFNWFKKYKYENTRRYVRLPASWPIKCVPKALSETREVTRTRDISAGGVAISVKQMVPVGSPIQMEIHIPPLDRSIVAEGQVIRCSAAQGGGFELGIRFINIDPKDRLLLNETIEEIHGPAGRARQNATWWRKFT